jgi:hypothetical protein
MRDAEKVLTNSHCREGVEMEFSWRANEWKVRLFVAALVAMVAAILMSILNRPSVNNAIAVAATAADVQREANEAIRLMPDLSVTSPPAIITPSTQENVLTYLIENTRTDEYLFEVKHYQLRDAGDWAKIDFAKLNHVLTNAREEKRPSFTDDIDVSLSGPYGGISFPLKKIIQALGFIDTVVTLNVDRIEIGIKGYADGQMRPGWIPPVPSLPLEFQKFPVLDPTDKYWMYYGKPEREREVSYPYENDDLPDLRAQYVRQLVETFLKNHTHPNAKRSRIYVLHNEPLSGRDQPQLRKAQIYVMVYLKREQAD